MSTRARPVVPWIAAVVLLSVAACAPTLRPPGASLRLLPTAPVLADDGDRASLAAAVGESIRYFARLPPDRSLSFGVATRTAGEMRAALEGLAEVLARAPSPAELATELDRRFEVYRATPPGHVTFTGYYLPTLPARAIRDARFRVPVLGRPSDLLTAALADFGAPCACREQIVGRAAEGTLAPYPTRTEIEAGGGGPVLAWVDDPVGLFFVQIQGSGVLAFPDGTRRTIGFAASNGRPYTSIGRVLVDRGALALDQASMAGIRAWLRDHPEEAPDLLRTNARYVFFRMLDGPPLGSLGVPVTAGRTIATDPAVFPSGALAFVAVPKAGPGVALSRLVLNQDAGAAIRGPGRVDVYFGDAVDAATTAGSLRSPGELYFFAPRVPRAR
ncbi:MAG: MltA domain-containing protein [Deltaproteobacteria bacterium]|nr:MltA domain-containing protein [Deltaproteobacteria bacterium]